MHLLQLSEGFQHVLLFISEVPHKAEKSVPLESSTVESMPETLDQVLGKWEKKACEGN